MGELTQHGATPTAGPDTVILGPNRVDRSSGVLVRANQPVQIEPMAWKMLCFMLDRPGTLVSKQELVDTVWDGAAVSDAAITRVVGALRRALGDDARHPRYVATVHRRGFRLLQAPKSAESAPAPRPPREQATSPAPEERAFVGREQELSALSEAAERATSGGCALVFVEGGPGIGKTALGQHWLARQDFGDRVTVGRCVKHHSTAEPYMPLLGALEGILRGPQGEERIAVLRQVAPTWLAQMPWLADAEDQQTLRDSVRDTSRPGMLRQLVRALEAFSEHGLLVLVLEDLHWADEATVDFLGAVGGLLRDGRLLIVGTYRPADAIVAGSSLLSRVRELHLRQQCTRVLLEPLGPEETHRFVERRLRSNEVPEDIGVTLFSLTGGNPLFLRATIDQLLDQDGLVRAPGGWELRTLEGASGLSHGPTDLEETLLLQLERLDPEERELLEAASVVGMVFEPALLATALGKDSPDGHDRIDKALERLETRWAGLRRIEGLDEWPDGTLITHYRFQHALYRNAASMTIGPARRARLHQRVGERLEKAYASDTERIATRLAGHFAQAQDHARAARYTAQLADVAGRRNAYDEAIALRWTALRHLERSPESDPLQELAIRALLALAQLRGPGIVSEDDDNNLKRVVALASNVNDSPAAFRSLSAVCRMQWSAGRIHVAELLARRICAIAETSGNDILRSEAQHTSALVASWLGDAADTEQRLNEARRLHADATDADLRQAKTWHVRSTDFELRCLAVETPILALQGHLEQSDALRIRLEALLEDGHPVFTEVGILHGIVADALRRPDTDYASALHKNTRGLALAIDHEVQASIVPFEMQRALILTRLGQPEAAADLLQDAPTRLHGIEKSLMHPWACLDFALVCLARGDYSAGISAVKRAIDHGERHGLRFLHGLLWHVRGRLLLERGGSEDRSRAIDSWEQARQVASSLGQSGVAERARHLLESMGT